MSETDTKGSKMYRMQNAQEYTVKDKIIYNFWTSFKKLFGFVMTCFLLATTNVIAQRTFVDVTQVLEYTSTLNGSTTVIRTSDFISLESDTLSFIVEATSADSTTDNITVDVLLQYRSPGGQYNTTSLAAMDTVLTKANTTANVEWGSAIAFTNPGKKLYGRLKVSIINNYSSAQLATIKVWRVRKFRQR